jgi:FixJ family two-component response regulator
MYRRVEAPAGHHDAMSNADMQEYPRSTNGACPHTYVALPFTTHQGREGNLMRSPPLAAIIDDDISMRESLPDLIKEFGYRTCAFASAAEFLVSDSLEEADCLILDVVMPGMSGPALQEELIARAVHTPIIFITANSNEVIRQRVMKNGAADVLLKPISESDLQDALKKVFGV